MGWKESSSRKRRIPNWATKWWFKLNRPVTIHAKYIITSAIKLSCWQKRRESSRKDIYSVHGRITPSPNHQDWKGYSSSSSNSRRAVSRASCQIEWIESAALGLLQMVIIPIIHFDSPATHSPPVEQQEKNSEIHRQFNRKSISQWDAVDTGHEMRLRWLCCFLCQKDSTAITMDYHTLFKSVNCGKLAAPWKYNLQMKSRRACELCCLWTWQILGLFGMWLSNGNRKRNVFFAIICEEINLYSASGGHSRWELCPCVLQSHRDKG